MCETLCRGESWRCYSFSCMWAGRLVLQSQNDSHAACCGQLYLLPSLTVHVCECIYKMDMTQPYELEGWFRLVHWANGTIMDIRGLSLPGICIWVFWNLTLLHKDASAPPVIYHNIKPVLYYNLIHLPLVQTKAMSVLCNFSKPFLLPSPVCFHQ